MKWLRFEGDRRQSFLFLYNKADLIAETERDSYVMEFSRLLGIEQQYFPVRDVPKLPSEAMQATSTTSSPDGYKRPLIMATGFPEIPFDRVRRDLHELLDAIF